MKVFNRMNHCANTILKIVYLGMIINSKVCFTIIYVQPFSYTNHSGHPHHPGLALAASARAFSK